MDFKDKLAQHYGFTERDWNETVSRYRPETLPGRSAGIGRFRNCIPRACQCYNPVDADIHYEGEYDAATLDLGHIDIHYRYPDYSLA